MTILEDMPNAPPPVEGFWSIEVVGKARELSRKRYVCHARGDLHADSMAKWMMAETRASLGYDLVRLESPAGDVPGLNLGDYMLVASSRPS